jgi:hypothetical protein
MNTCNGTHVLSKQCTGTQTITGAVCRSKKQKLILFFISDSECANCEEFIFAEGGACLNGATRDCAVPDLSSLPDSGGANATYVFEAQLSQFTSDLSVARNTIMYVRVLPVSDDCYNTPSSITPTRYFLWSCDAQRRLIYTLCDDTYCSENCTQTLYSEPYVSYQIERTDQGIGNYSHNSIFTCDPTLIMPSFMDSYPSPTSSGPAPSATPQTLSPVSPAAPRAAPKAAPVGSPVAITTPSLTPASKPASAPSAKAPGASSASNFVAGALPVVFALVAVLLYV